MVGRAPGGPFRLYALPAAVSFCVRVPRAAPRAAPGAEGTWTGSRAKALESSGREVIRGAVSWGPAALWAAVLFLLSSLPDLGTPGWLAVSDKVAHGLAFTVLGASLAWARVRAPDPWPHPAFVLLGTLYGASDEWHQSFVPGRDPSGGDLLADVLGVLVGYSALLFLLARARRRGAAPPSGPLAPEEASNA